MDSINKTKIVKASKKKVIIKNDIKVKASAKALAFVAPNKEVDDYKTKIAPLKKLISNKSKIIAISIKNELNELIKNKVDVQKAELLRIIECILYPKHKSGLQGYNKITDAALLLRLVFEQKHIQITDHMFKSIYDAYTSMYYYHKPGLKYVLDYIINDKKYDPPHELYDSLIRNGFKIAYKVHELYTKDTIQSAINNITDYQTLSKILKKYNESITCVQIRDIINKNIVNIEDIDHLLSLCSDYAINNDISMTLLLDFPTLFEKYADKIDVIFIKYVLSNHTKLHPDKYVKVLDILSKKANDKDIQNILSSIISPFIVNRMYSFPSVLFDQSYGNESAANNAMNYVNDKSILVNPAFLKVKMLSQYFNLNASHLKTTNIQLYICLRALGIKPTMDTFHWLCGSSTHGSNLLALRTATDLSILEDCINHKMFPDEECMISSTNTTIKQFLYLRNEGGLITEKVLDAVIKKICHNNARQMNFEELYHDKETIYRILAQYGKTRYIENDIFKNLSSEVKIYFNSIYSSDFSSLAKTGLTLSRVPSKKEIDSLGITSVMYLILLSLDNRLKDYLLENGNIKELINKNDETKRYYQVLKDNYDQGKIDLNFDINKLINNYDHVTKIILELLKLTLSIPTNVSVSTKE